MSRVELLHRRSAVGPTYAHWKVAVTHQCARSSAWGTRGVGPWTRTEALWQDRRSCPRPIPVILPTMQKLLLFGTELYALPILRPLAAAARARGLQVRWYLHDVDHAQLNDTEVLLSTGAVRAYAPDVVYAASNWVPDFFPGLKVQLFHGFSVDKRSQQKGHYRIRGLFDLYCTQGPETTVGFRQLAMQHRHFSVAETGWPKLDPLFRPTQPSTLDLIGAAGRPIVLFGSTFTDGLSAAPLLLRTLRELIAQGDHYWLLTLHPRCSPELFARYRSLCGDSAQFVESDRLIELMRAADVLLADTTSLVSEFVVQHKPAVTFRNAAPKRHMLNVSNEDEVGHALETALSEREGERMQALHHYADQIHPYRDGRCSERVLDATAAALANPPTECKPLNLWRKLQIRQRMGW